MRRTRASHGVAATSVTALPAAIALIGSTVVVACAPPEKGEPKPKAPDMTVVANQFTNPTGALNIQGQLDDLLRDVLEKSGRLKKMSPAKVLRPALASVAQASDTKVRRGTQSAPGLDAQSNAGPPTDPGVEPTLYGVDGNGWVAVTRLCDGWGAVPAAEPASGSLLLNAGFTDKGLDPVVWGSASACKYLVEDGGAVYKVQIDIDPTSGKFALFIGDLVSFEGVSPNDPVAFQQVDLQPVIVSFKGKVTVNDDPQDLEADFQIDPKARSLAFLFPAPGGGNFLVTLRADGTLELRATNATLTCNVAQRSCTTPGGKGFNF